MIRNGAIGIGLAAFGVYALVVDFSPWSLLWFVFVWYGYFLLLSAMTTRPGFSLFATEFDAMPLFCWSIPFWFFFEAYNVVIQNWYYVFGLRDWTASVLFSSVAFATVLPACLVHARLVDRAGWFTSVIGGVPSELGGHWSPASAYSASCARFSRLSFRPTHSG